MTEEIFKSAIGYLQVLFGVITAEKFSAYWQAIKHIEDESFKRSVSEIIKSFHPTSTEPFPSPSRFESACGNDEETRVQLAVAAVKSAASRVGVYRSVSFGDRALHAVIERFGGWPSVAKWGDDEWKFQESKFIAGYRSEIHAGINGPSHLSGLQEEDYNLKVGLIPEEKRAIFLNGIKPRQFKWFAYKELIEDKSEGKKRIICEPESLGDLMKGIL